MLSGIASLLSIVILSRLLPAEAYGRIAVVLAIASVCQVAAFSWIQASITRLAPEGQAARDRFAAGVRAGFMLSSAAMALACAAFLLAFRPSPEQTALGIAGLAVLLCNAWAAAGQAWSRVSDHPWRYAMSRSVQALVGLGLAIAGLAWRPGDPLVPLVAAAVASLLASSIAHVPGARGGSLRAVAPQLRRMLVYAGPLVAVALGWVVLGAADPAVDRNPARACGGRRLVGGLRPRQPRGRPAACSDLAVDAIAGVRRIRPPRRRSRQCPAAERRQLADRRRPAGDHPSGVRA
jgi:O-antigen/teichoic acid export membrane protein